MGLDRLRDCVIGITDLFESTTVAGPNRVGRCRGLLRSLISVDDWLPEELSKPHPDRYQQYLLHCDPLQRFSLVSFVWGPGQSTPIHDHTIWGLIGVMRGAEFDQPFVWHDHRMVARGNEVKVERGMIGFVSPEDGTDVHRVRNAFADQASISIHLYGANIGAVQRHVYDAETGEKKTFVSGYANATVPNLWQTQSK